MHPEHSPLDLDDLDQLDTRLERLLALSPWTRLDETAALEIDRYLAAVASTWG
jgi:hypothetical protein